MNMLKMAKHTFKILWCEHSKIFKVFLPIFQHYVWKGKEQKRIINLFQMISMVNQWLSNDLGHSGGKELFKVYVLCSCILNIDSDHLFGLKEGIFLYSFNLFVVECKGIFCLLINYLHETEKEFVLVYPLHV